MNLTTKRMNLRRALFSSTALASILGGMILTASNPAQAQQTETRSISNPNITDSFYMSEPSRQKAERSLDRNNCALFNSVIKCAYGDAGHRNHILKSVGRGHAVPFRGDGRVLQSYIDQVGLDKVIRELQRLDIDY